MAKILSVSLYVLCALGVAALIGKAIAAPKYMYEIWYYSDNTFSQQVGYEVFTCDPNYSLDGYETAYFHQYVQDCQAGHPNPSPGPVIVDPYL